jgi:1-deoxy-D-xylulose 5-phosphate reductoisomerase
LPSVSSISSGPTSSASRGPALAYRALAEEGVAPAVLNAANEVAGCFLDGALGFDRIPR